MAGCFCLGGLLSSRARASRQRRKLKQRGAALIPVRAPPAAGDADDNKWAALPPDLLLSIVPRLSVAEHVRLRAVCTSWFHALKGSHPFLLDRRPWLMLNHYEDSSRLSIVSPLQGQSCRLPFLPKLSGGGGDTWCAGHKDGWLVVHHKLDILLLNPITGEQLPFPSFYAQPEVDHNARPCVSKVVLSDTPTTAPDVGEIIAMAVTSTGDIAYAKSTDRNWTHMAVTENSAVRDIVYHMGMFCILCSGPNTWELSADFVGRYRQSQLTMLSLDGQTTSTVQYEYMDQLEEGVITLASSPTGDLVLLLGVQDPDSKLYSKFSVMAWQGGLGSYWVKVEHLGDQALFVDSLQTTLIPIAADVDHQGLGLEKDRIYLAKIICNSRNEVLMDSGVFRIDGGDAVGPCFPVSLSSILRNELSSFFPFWFTPSLS
ncbi:putative F-box protein [Iris pallida]|uniref:F-box protein n=1 Tax=Iris pallida TaxID=29817 RepID=A0AAX6H232_IRIPA|nr:putative F-box protein [Iris pallida]